VAGPANCSAIADDIQTEIYIIQTDFVMRLCATDWELSERLNRIVALKQARRLRHLNANRGKGPLVKQDSAKNTAASSAAAISRVQIWLSLKSLNQLLKKKKNLLLLALV